MPRKSSNTLGKVLSWFACRKCIANRMLPVNPIPDANSISPNHEQLEIAVSCLAVEQAVNAELPNFFDTDPSNPPSLCAIIEPIDADQSAPSHSSSDNSEDIDTTQSEDRGGRSSRLAHSNLKLLMLCDIPTQSTGHWLRKVCQIRYIRVIQLPRYSMSSRWVNAMQVCILFCFIWLILSSISSQKPSLL